MRSRPRPAVSALAEIHRTLSFLSMASWRASAYRSIMRILAFTSTFVVASCTSHPASPPTSAFTTALTSRTASPQAVDLYAPLIGSWSVNVTDYAEDGRASRGTGEWHFSRVLDGRGVQDVWISPPRRD